MEASYFDTLKVRRHLESLKSSNNKSRAYQIGLPLGQGDFRCSAYHGRCSCCMLGGAGATLKIILGKAVIIIGTAHTVIKIQASDKASFQKGYCQALGFSC